MNPAKFLTLLILLRASSAFTPQSFLSPINSDVDIDITTGTAYLGLTTFANLAYESSCFSTDANQSAPAATADIFILGAPFDTDVPNVSARPGARYGPSGIRAGSTRIAPEFAYDEMGFNAFQSWARIVDCGDVPMLPFDNRIALAQLQKAYEVIVGKQARNGSVASVPRIVMLGGDHTITLPALRAASKTWGPLAVVHFDSHIDTWSPEVLGGVSKYAGINHGTWGWHAWKEDLISDHNIHVGIRAPYSSPREDLETDRKAGFEIIYAKAIDRIGVQGIIAAIKARVGDRKVYMSIDIDVLDPAFAPATGTPETGGYSTRELLAILDGLENLNIVGADVVEVAPAYDDAGQITALAGASIAHSILGLMVKKPVK